MRGSERLSRESAKKTVGKTLTKGGRNPSPELRSSPGEIIGLENIKNRAYWLSHRQPLTERTM